MLIPSRMFYNKCKLILIKALIWNYVSTGWTFNKTQAKVIWKKCCPPLMLSPLLRPLKVTMQAVEHPNMCLSFDAMLTTKYSQLYTLEFGLFV